MRVGTPGRRWQRATFALFILAGKSSMKEELSPRFVVSLRPSMSIRGESDDDKVNHLGAVQPFLIRADLLVENSSLKESNVSVLPAVLALVIAVFPSICKAATDPSRILRFLAPYNHEP
jgi:hypothetical protein